MLAKQKFDEIGARREHFIENSQTSCTGDRDVKFQVCYLYQKELQSLNMNILQQCEVRLRNKRYHFRYLLLSGYVLTCLPLGLELRHEPECTQCEQPVSLSPERPKGFREAFRWSSCNVGLPPTLALKTVHFPHRVLLCVSYDAQNRQQMFP